MVTWLLMLTLIKIHVVTPGYLTLVNGLDKVMGTVVLLFLGYLLYHIYKQNFLLM